MKKSISGILIAAMLSLMLCGCGSYRNDGNMERQDEIMPDVTPMVTPDVSDGFVDDRDGRIEDQERGEENDSLMPSAEPTIQPERP